MWSNYCVTEIGFHLVEYFPDGKRLNPDRGTDLPAQLNKPLPCHKTPYHVIKHLRSHNT